MAGPSQAPALAKFKTATDLRCVSRFITSMRWVTDCSTLSNIAEDTILTTLRERYLASNPYTSLSFKALVSVNPHAYVPTNGDASLQDYVAEYYNCVVDDGMPREERPAVLEKERLQPHIFRLALNAFYNMRRTNQDQIMILR